MKKQNKRFRRLALITAGILVVIECGVLISLFGRTSQKSQLDAQIQSLTEQKESLQLYLNMYTNLSRVKAEAEAMGMQLPTDDQIRVVHVPTLSEDDRTLTADGTGSK